jgi:hypothetical protein
MKRPVFMYIFIFILGVNHRETLPNFFQVKINYVKDNSFHTEGVCYNRNVELIQEVKI